MIWEELFKIDIHDKNPYDHMMGTRHHNRGNYLFADGHVKLMSVRQTLAPKVLWDNAGEWCPDCGCREKQGWTDWNVTYALKMLDKYHYP